LRVELSAAASLTAAPLHWFDASGPVTSVAWSKSGVRLATGSRDGRLRVYEVGRWVEGYRNVKAEICAVAWDPTGEDRVLCGLRDGTAVIVTVSTGREEHRYRHTSRAQVQSVAWSHCGSLVVVAQACGTICVYAAAALRRISWSAKLPGDWSGSVSFGADSQWLFVSPGRGDRCAMTIDLPARAGDRETRRDIGPRGAFAAAISSCGSRLVTAHAQPHRVFMGRVGTNPHRMSTPDVGATLPGPSSCVAFPYEDLDFVLVGGANFVSLVQMR
jgi:WD40 repeat protein